VAVCIVVPVVLLLIATHHSGSSDASLGTDPGLTGKQVIRAGDRAPTFTLPTLDGHAFNTATLSGKPYILTFWGSWCIPCRKEMPLLQQVYTEHTGALPVVGVTFQDPESDSRAFVRAHGITFPILPDDGVRVATAYGVLNGIPTTFFVDGRGVVTDRVFGIERWHDLDTPLRHLLAAPTPPS
jgi:peroxiredoxin